MNRGCELLISLLGLPQAQQRIGAVECLGGCGAPEPFCQETRTGPADGDFARKTRKTISRPLLDLVPLACAALVIVGRSFGTGVVLLGHQADAPPKPSVSTATSRVF